MKKFDGHEAKIYSYAARDTIIDMSCQIAKFMKEHYPNIKYIRDIKASHLNEFLKTKVNICTDTTIKQYKARITKLEHICNKKYNLELDWSKNIKIEKSNKATSIRTVAFTSEQVQAIRNEINKRRDCDSKKAILTFELYGMRASEIVNLRKKDFDFDKMTIHIHKSKGGRNRDIAIRPEHVKTIKALTKNKLPKDKLFNVKASSISSYLSNICKKLGYNEFIEAKSSIHALRKYAAREFYKEQLKKYNKKVALENTMNFLGHGKERSDLKRTYLGEEY